MFYGVIHEAVSDRLQLSDFKLVNLTKAYIDKYNIKGIQPNDSKHKSIGWERVKGVLVAKVDVYYDPKNKDFGERHCINNLEVDKRYRNKGLGTQVLNYAVKKLGGDFIIVEASNKIAFNMYKKYGFKIGSDTEKKNGKVKYYQMYLKFPKGIKPINEAATITLYHGSNKDIKSDYLKPKNNSREDDDYVFATPDKYFALCYSGKIWNSKGMNLSKYNGKIVLTELKKDYINKTYNTDGYLYTVKDNGSFQKRGNLELLSKEPIEILSKEYIDNILKELESSSEVELYYYPNKPKWWDKVKGK